MQVKTRGRKEDGNYGEIYIQGIRAGAFNRVSKKLFLIKPDAFKT